VRAEATLDNVARWYNVSRDAVKAAVAWEERLAA
jgi:hypothetical protein